MNRIDRVVEYCKKNDITLLQYTLDIVRSKHERMLNNLKECIRLRTIDRKNRERLANTDCSILSINCNGCTIAHDLGLRFNSQFVNLWLTPKDYLEYLHHLDYYNSQPLTFVKDGRYSHPVGIVGGLTIYFTHYLTEEDAREKWEIRKERIKRDNLFVMMTDQEGCTEEQMREFDSLPFENKVLFTHVPHPEIPSTFYIHGFENQDMVGKLNGWTGRFSVKKYYDQFDYVEWLNSGKIVRTKD